ATAGRTGDQRRTVFGKAAFGDDVETGNAGAQLLNCGMILCRHDASARGGEDDLDATGRTSSPSRTLSLSERSPITRRSGGGSCLIRVGVARIRSSSARCGFSRTSTISSSYLPDSSWVQIRFRFSMAILVRGLLPVTYSVR